MNENEMELLRMIREHDDPEWAFMTALGTITSFLEQHGSSGGQEPVYQQELAGIS